MSRGLSGATLKLVGALFRDGVPDRGTDAELLSRFEQARGEAAEAAFAALVERHGPMVLRVCRDALGDEHDAEDAFQATFLVLSRKARTVRNRDSVASWLHGVALRVSARGRASTARRRRHEGRAAEMAGRRDPIPAGSDLPAAIRDEVGRLPEKYREPVILCYLEGLTHDAAADRLGWPVGTVRSRLAGARDRLRPRLARRGLAPTSALLIATLARGSVRADVRPALVDATARAGAMVAAGLTPSIASVEMLGLFQATSREITMSRLKMTAPALLVAGLATAGAVLASHPARQIRPEPKASPVVQAPAEDPVLRAVREALPGAEALTDPDARTQALLALGKAQLAAGDKPAALATLRKAEDASGQIQAGTWRNLWVIEIAKTRAGAGDRDGALGQLARLVLDTAKYEGLRSKVGGWGVIAEAQAKVGDATAARETIRRAHRAIADAKEGEDTLNPLDDLVRSQARVGDYDGALDAIAALPPERSNEQDPLLRMLAHVAGESPSPAVIKALRRADAIAERITYPVPKSGAKAKIAEELAKAGDIPGALAIVRGMRGGVARFFRSGSLSGAGDDMIPLALAEIGKAQAARGDREGAKATLREALEVATGLQVDGVIKPERLRRVAEAQAGVGDLDGASLTVDLIGSNGNEMASALLAVAEAQAKAGKAELSRETFRKAIEAAEGLVGRPTLIGDDPDRNKLNLLRMIAEAQARSGDFAGAVATATGRGDESWRAGVLTDVASTQARAGDIAGALKTADLIRDGFYKPHAVEAIAEAQAKAGDVAGALAWATRIESPEARARALAGLARGASRPRP